MLLKEEFSKFHELVKNQFVYGGKKYGLNSTRESTDVLFEKHGKNWLFGTMDKYIFRYRNLARERDILKIATYSYILWLKKGFFIKSSGLSIDVLDTNVEMKERFFNDFTNKIETTLDHWKKFNLTVQFENGDLEKKLDFLSGIFDTWSKESWDKLTEWSIVSVYYSMFVIWLEFYSNAEKHDEDNANLDDKK